MTTDNLAAPSTRAERNTRQRTGLLRNAADRRSLFWSLGLFPLPLVVAFLSPKWLIFALPLTLYLAFCAGVLTHYHNHAGVFRSRFLNRLYSVWLSVFYGFPIFSWIPTHNQNHHKYTNGPLDATSTFRSGQDDSLFQLLVYPIRSGAWQFPALRAYMSTMRRRGSSEYAWALTESAAVVAANLGVAYALVHFHGLGQGLLAYALSLMVPLLFAPYFMMFINYLQHIGCDPNSPHDHSRNFVGRFENWLVFEAGLHTVHHEHPGTHWSEYPKLHEARVGALAPILQQRNVFSFLYQRYLRGDSSHLLVTRLETRGQEIAI